MKNIYKPIIFGSKISIYIIVICVNFNLEKMINLYFYLFLSSFFKYYDY